MANLDTQDEDSRSESGSGVDTEDTPGNTGRIGTENEDNKTGTDSGTGSTGSTGTGGASNTGGSR